MENPNRKRDRTTLGCMAMALVLPLVICLCLFGVYKYNNRPPHVSVPTHALPANNAFDDWVAAGTMVKGMTHKSPISMSDPEKDYTFANFEACYTDSRPALAIFRSGLKKPYMHPVSRSFATLFPHFSSNREMARVISAEAYYYQCVGQYGKAVDSRLDGMEFGGVLPKGAPLIGGLVGVACMAISEQNIEVLITKLSRPELEKTARRLETIETKMVPFSEVIQEEGYQCVAGIQDFMRQTQNPMAMIIGITGLYGGGGGSSPEATWLSVRFAFTNKQAMLESQMAYFRDMASDAEKPYVGQSTRRAPEGPLSEILFPVFARARVAFEAQKAVVNILQLEVALRLYYTDNHRYPAKLSELVPKYVHAIPPDPFGNKPFVYRLNSPNNYLLYSIGVNFRDDGGRAGKTIRDPDTDIVAGSLARTKAPLIKIKGAPVPTDVR